MKVLLILVTLVAIVAAEFHSEWYVWRKEHGKEYKDQESEQHRYDIWKANAAMIEEHNKHAAVRGFTLGMNEFGDMTSKEFVKVFNGYRMHPEKNNTSNLFKPNPNFVAEESLDWRDRGVVTAIKNQGQCGSCWAFSTTGSLEGQHILKYSMNVSLSEQNLLDCTHSYGNEGCGGGWVDRSFQYVIQNDGIDTEISYPYLAQEETCHYEESHKGATASSYRDIKQGSTSDLVEACTKVGPISVAMDASRESFHFYKKGVYKDSACSTTNLDHAVLLIGYGTLMGQDYLLVKNSWGTSWGMDGYFMISKSDNMCGLATQASYPIV